MPARCCTALESSTAPNPAQPCLPGGATAPSPPRQPQLRCAEQTLPCLFGWLCWRQLAAASAQRWRRAQRVALGCIRSCSGCSSSRCAAEGQALATCGGRTEAWPSSQRACLDGGLVCALQGQVQGGQALIRPPGAVQGGAVDGCVQQSTHAFRPAPLLCVLQQHLPGVGEPGWRERWHSGKHAACFEHQYKPPAGTAGGHQQAAAIIAVEPLL